jgi:hypothetical protein
VGKLRTRLRPPCAEGTQTFLQLSNKQIVSSRLEKLHVRLFSDLLSHISSYIMITITFHITSTTEFHALQHMWGADPPI